MSKNIHRHGHRYKAMSIRILRIPQPLIPVEDHGSAQKPCSPARSLHLDHRHPLGQPSTVGTSDLQYFSVIGRRPLGINNHDGKFRSGVYWLVLSVSRLLEKFFCL